MDTSTLWHAPLFSPGGFSLIEVVTAMGVVTLLAGCLVAATILPQVALARSREDVSLVAGALRAARWNAITERSEFGVRFSPGPGGHGWQADILRKEAGVWTAAEAPRTLASRDLGLRVSGPAIMEFNPDGTSTSGSVLLSWPGRSSWKVTTTAATGRIRVAREGS
jgi:Tfp pilus assembly protein FimT